MKNMIFIIAMITGTIALAQAPVLFGDNLEGNGSKMMWIPEKGAFRAGLAGSMGAWNSESVGSSSLATGFATKAAGLGSTAMGWSTTASSWGSTAMGYNATASKDYSTAMGYETTASGISATAMGYETTASGISSTAMGRSTTASGGYSTAMGYLVSTNGHSGALIIGDSDPKGEGTTLGGLDDEFVARFANGYYFMTSGNNIRTGMRAGPGANMWSGISDVNRKENFQPMDDKQVLNKLASVDYSSWNYIGQDPETFRHYGIMAQDFHELFGQDNYGTIGNDTLVNPLDMMGVAMSAIKGAKLEIEELKNENEKIIAENLELRESSAILESRILAIEKLLAIKNVK